MPSAKFAIEPNGEKRLVVSWTGLWKNIVVSFDGQEIGSFASKKELNQGKSFRLPDRSDIHIRFHQGFGSAEWQLTRDGVPLPGSPSDPAEQVKQAAYVVYFIAGLNGLLGFIAVLFDVELLQQIGIGWPALASAALYAVLGYFTMQRSRAALLIAIILFILDGVVSMGMSIGARGTPPTAGIITRIFLIMPMIRGFKAMSALKQPDKNAIKQAFD